MGKTLRKAGFLVGIIASLLVGKSAAFADGDSNAPLVTVSYVRGKTDLRELKVEDHFYSNRVSALRDAPTYLIGLQRTCRAAESPADLTIDAASGAAIYLLIDSDNGKNANVAGVAELHNTLAKSHWSRLDELNVGAPSSKLILTVYRRTVTAPTHLTIAGAGYTGVIVASANLKLEVETPARGAKASASEEPAPLAPGPARASTRVPSDSRPISGPAAKIANPQATIKILGVYSADGEEMGGQATDFILTVTPGKTPQLVNPHFVTPVGKDMLGVTDDVLRYLHVKYPNWYADKAEFTFSNRMPYDGPSIGAAVGTIIRAVIEGFQIDPAAAITGDIAANGGIHAIGGLAFKLRGAASAGCTIVAVPMENYNNLVDAVIYKGTPVVSQVQVIGMSTLDDAVATMRIDRDAKLSQAINLFAAVEQTLKDDPKSLQSAQMQANLQDIVNNAPKHLSARILLLASQKKLPRTLSATASIHYMSAAVDVMIPVLKDREKFNSEHKITSSVVQQQLADLSKLHYMADVKVQPMIEAWSRFIRAWSDLETGHGSKTIFEAQLQKLRDELAKGDADPDLKQELVNEGM